jgi:predicted kinase
MNKEVLMNKVIILVGCSGSGKSTLAKACEAFAVVSADSFPGLYQDGRLVGRLLGEAHTECGRQFLHALQKGWDVVVDNTNTTVAQISPYIFMAQMHGIVPRIYVMPDVDIHTAAARNAHGADAWVIRRQQRQIAQLLNEWPPFWPRPILLRELDGLIEEKNT